MPLHADEVEWILISAVKWLSLIIEAIGVIVIALGVFGIAYKFVRALTSKNQSTDFHQIRLMLGRYLALALEFQLGADILSTAVAPGWDEIGKLGAIAIIRTGLNLFLMREMRAREMQAREMRE